MVYQKTHFKVLLGPEKIPGDDTDSSDDEAPEPTKKHTDRSGFEKMGDSHVYKRTRPFQIAQPRPRLERHPSGLQLSGLKLHRDTSSPKHEEENGRNRVESDFLVPYNTEITSFKFDTNNTSALDNDDIPPLDINNISYPITSGLQTVRSSRYAGYNTSRVSRYFLNDFGLRSHRTDTFSGHSARRGVSADINREMQETANKHIKACQAIGNVKRGSKAQLSYLGLRHTVSPSHLPLRRYHMDAFSQNIPKSHTDKVLRVEPEPNKTVPYVVQLRRNIGSIARVKNKGLLCQPNNPLPEISGRTLVLGSVDNIWLTTSITLIELSGPCVNKTDKMYCSAFIWPPH